MLCLVRNPMKIGSLVPQIQAIEVVFFFFKTIENKDFSPFVWLYLKINIYKFQPILLDHITYTINSKIASVVFARFKMRCTPIYLKGPRGRYNR